MTASQHIPSALNARRARPASCLLVLALITSTIASAQLQAAPTPGKNSSEGRLAFNVAPLGTLPGALDDSFGTEGRMTIAVDPSPTLEDHALISAPRASGGYLVYGFLPSTGDIVINARTDAGANDPSFGVNGRVIYNDVFLTVEDAVIDNLGRVIIVGNTRPPGAPSLALDPYLCRFTAGGFRDTAFGANGTHCRSYPVDAMTNGTDYATAATTDAGSIYVAGQVQLNTQGDYDFLVLRINAGDGTLVSSFDGDGMLYIPFDIDGAAPGGDTDGALAIARDGEAGLYIGGYAKNDGSFENDWVVAKVNIFSGTYFSNFCANTTDCPSSERLNGRRHQPIVTGFGGNREQVQGFAVGADGNLVTVVQRYTQVNGNTVQQIETIKLNSTTGATIAGQRDARTYLTFTSLGDIAIDAAGNVVQSGVSSFAEGDDPQRVIFVTRLTPTLAGDTTFSTSFGGGGSATTLIDFPRAASSTLLDHSNNTLVLDASGRIVVTGSRLWRRDIGADIFDYDHAVFRLNGGSGSTGSTIFANGFE